MLSARASRHGTRLVLAGANHSLARRVTPPSSITPMPSTLLAGRRLALVLAIAGAAACTRSDAAELPAAQRAAIADTVRGLLTNAYDLSKPGDAVARLMS